MGDRQCAKKSLADASGCDGGINERGNAQEIYLAQLNGLGTEKSKHRTENKCRLSLRESNVFAFFRGEVVNLLFS